MKKTLAVLTVCALLLSAFPLGVFATAISQAEVEVTYNQTEARRMLQMINDFRLGDNAWAWNKTDTEKVPYAGLKAFAYDYDLEKAAMQRAAELALSYNHDRPDGSECFTAYDWMSCGENIAWGYNCFSTAEEVFEAWAEADEPFAGQGHRRNMLGRFAAVAVACCSIGREYFWVQEFRTPASKLAETAANNGKTAVPLRFDADQFPVSGLTAVSPTIGVGEQKIAATAKSGDATILATDGAVTFDDPAVAKAENGYIIGLKAGSTAYTVTAYGLTASGTVTVLGTACTHVWDGGLELEPATCSTTGLVRYTCTLCGETREEYTPVDPENHMFPIVLENAAEATCESDGYSGDYVCSRCGTVLQAGETIPATGHDWGDWGDNHDGTHVRGCRNDNSHQESEPHDWGEPVRQAPTCTTGGFETYTCARCGAIRMTTLFATGHNLVHHRYEATCIYAGSEYDECVVCGERFHESAWTPLGHVDEDLDGKCDRCGEKLGEAPDPVSELVSEPKPTEPASEPKTTEPAVTEPKTTEPPATEPTTSAPEPTTAAKPEPTTAAKPEPTTEVLPPFAGLRGDADGDGKVLAKDARLVLRASARLETLDEAAFRRCDLDGNGKLLAGEARMILRYSAKLETAI